MGEIKEHPLKAIMRRIADAKASNGGDRITDGRYEFIVKNLIFEVKDCGPTFIAELYVIESSPLRDDVKPNAVGSSPGFVCALDSTKSAAGNAKAFVLALFGEKEDEISDEDFIDCMAEACTAPSPTIGMRIGAETYRKITKGGPNAGKSGTYPKWATRSNTPEEVSANVKIISAAAAKKGSDAKAA